MSLLAMRTPADAVENTVQETIILDGQRFEITRPADPDRLLDHPAIVEAFQRDEYMPYWCDLWPSARMLGKAILRCEWPAGMEVLEIGCGLGLPGIVALSKGLRVTFSDYDATALEFAEQNARQNGFTKFELALLDWRQPIGRRFPLILGADLFYEARNVAPIVELLKVMLAKDGECLLADQDRTHAPLLRQTLAEHGLEYTPEPARAGQPGGRVKGTLYRVCHNVRHNPVLA